MVNLISKARQRISQQASRTYKPIGDISKIFSSGVEINYPNKKLRKIIGEGAKCASTLSACERVFLYNEASSHIQEGRFLEVGSYMGASAIVLAEALKKSSEHLQSKKVYCIDTWQNDAMSEGNKDTYQNFLTNTRRWSDFVVPIRGNSQSASFPDEKLYDVIFIDADHSYEGCHSDVARFAPLVREGGCLILDDHISYTGVTRIVGELLSSGEWYIGASHYNVVSLYRDQKSVSKTKRLRRWNRSL